jgi:hypothetical protein
LEQLIEQKAKPPQRNYGLIVAVMALVVSFTGQILTLRATLDQSMRDAVERSYSSWLQVSRMQADFADVAHMFALPDEYDNVSTRVRAAAGAVDEPTRAREQLRERAVAVYMFTMYEATLYQLGAATKTAIPIVSEGRSVPQRGRQSMITSW